MTSSAVVGVAPSSEVSFDEEVAATRAWFASPRFERIRRLHSADQIVQQRGTIPADATLARETAAAFYARLRELFEQGRSITTFGPYSPGQAVIMKRMGIEGIYLGGWATSAKGSANEDPGPDLASYPLSQVPEEAAGLVRALLTADRNQAFLRSRMTPVERRSSAPVDFRPFIIADADTGHGGEPHVRNLVRRFVEVGVPGYHIEDQRPGTKKCGHQGGKVLVSSFEQIKRLNAARFQLDVMGVAGIIVARTDAEAANLIDSRSDERDQPYILGVTNPDVPSYRVAFLALLRRFQAAGVADLYGHQLYAIAGEEYRTADAWLDATGVGAAVDAGAAEINSGADVDVTLDRTTEVFLETWEADAGLCKYAEAVAMRLRQRSPVADEASLSDWLSFAATTSHASARARAAELGVEVTWDAERAVTPDGYYQVQGGIPYAIAKSLAAAPFADVLWMETKTADLADAREFAEAIHAVFPEQMLAYNLSPSFNWDSTGMSDDEMRTFPEELGRLGYVFNFITYGGHQVDGLASEEFAAALREEGMLALARLQRRIRLIGSPYRTPQTLVGGPRADAALAAASGRTATTMAMGKGSTQHQHTLDTELSPSVLDGWLRLWADSNGVESKLRTALRPYRAGGDRLELTVADEGGTAARIVFDVTEDRMGGRGLLVVDQMTIRPGLRRRRLMTLVHLFLIRRFRAGYVQFLRPTEDNRLQANRMLEIGMFNDVSAAGDVIIARVDRDGLDALVTQDESGIRGLVAGSG